MTSPSLPLAVRLLGFVGVSPPIATRYVSRGPYLLVSWALALALFYSVPAVLFPLWPSIAAAIPSSWLGSLLVLTTTTNVGTQVLLNLALLPVYASGACDRWKADPSRPWPWSAAASEAERVRFWAAVRKTFPLVTFNMLVVAALGLVALSPLVAALGLSTPLDAASLPSYTTLAWQLAVCLIVEDGMFYASHSLLHTPFLYARVHKLHHDYSSVIGIASEHAHPIEFVLGNLLPVIAGPLLVRAHAATTCIFLALRLAVSVEEHSGLALPWSPMRCTPWAALAEGHDFHHAKTVGVFASEFGWWDAAFGTNVAFERWLEAQDQQRVAAAGKRAK